MFEDNDLGDDGNENIDLDVTQLVLVEFEDIKTKMDDLYRVERVELNELLKKFEFTFIPLVC